MFELFVRNGIMFFLLSFLNFLNSSGMEYSKSEVQKKDNNYCKNKIPVINYPRKTIYNNEEFFVYKIILRSVKNSVNRVLGEEFLKNNKGCVVVIIDGNRCEQLSPNCVYYFEPNLYKLNVYSKSLIKNFSYMFFGCEGLSSLKLNNLITDDVTDISYMFCGCSDLVNLSGLSSWNIENVTIMSHLFIDCE